TLESITNDLLWQREEKEMIVIDGVEYELKEIKRLLNNRTEAKTEEPKETLYKCIKAVAMEDDSIKFTKNNVYRGFHEDNCRYLQNASKNTQ
ncbi:MAG: hypothetical protein GY928_37570, partial [Colwellia sp.]|nr:hypothetical protein [Colwellia sp.]